MDDCIIQSKINASISPFRYAGFEKCYDFYNTLTSDGVCRDYAPLLWFYRTVGIFKRIIDIIPDNAIKDGITVNADNQILIEQYLEEINYKKYISTAFKQARLYGRSLIVLSIDDGQYVENDLQNGEKVIDNAKPVKYENIKTVDFAYIYTSNQFEIAYKEGEESILNWEYYRLTIVRNNQQNQNKTTGDKLEEILIHKSRALLIVNDDIYTDASRINKYATGEFFRVFQPITRLIQVEESVTADAQNSQTAIIKADLTGIYNNTKDDDERHNVAGSLLNKLNIVDGARKAKNSILIDKEEDFKLVTSSLSGFGDLIEKLRKDVSSASDVPMSILFGEKQSGLSNDGSKDLEVFYNVVKSAQERYLRLPINYIIKLINCQINNNSSKIKQSDKNKQKPTEEKQRTLIDRVKEFFRKDTKEGPKEEQRDFFKRINKRITFEFNQLWQISAKEQAEIDKIKAETYSIYKNIGVIDVEEIRNQSELNDIFKYNDNNKRDKKNAFDASNTSKNDDE